MNIVFFSNKDPFRSTGGIQKHIRDLIGASESHGLNATCISADNLPGIGTGNKRVCASSSIERKLNKFCGSLTPIIVLQGSSSIFLYQTASVCRGMGIRYFWTPHFHPFHTQKYPRLSELWFRMFEANLVKRSRKIFVLSEHEREVFKLLIGSVNNIEKIKNGVFFSTQSQYDCDLTQNYLLFVGRDSPNKGLDLLIAQAGVAGEVGFDIVIVGVEGLRLKGLPPNVKCIGHPSDIELAKLYRRAAATIVPSRYEAFSYVAVESLSHGTPIVISENVMSKEYFQGKEYCWTVNFSREGRLREVLSEIRALKNEQRRAIRYLSIDAAREFDLKNTTRDILSRLQ